MASFMNENPLQKLGLLLSGIASTTSRDPRYLQTNLVMQDAFQEMRDREQAQQQDQQQRDILAKLVSPQFIGTPATKAFQVNGRTVGQNAPAQVMQTTPDAQLRALAQMPGFREAALTKLLSQRFAGPAKPIALGEKDRLIDPNTGATLIDAVQTEKEPTDIARRAVEAGFIPGSPQYQEFIRNATLRPNSVTNVNMPDAKGDVKYMEEMGKLMAADFARIQDAGATAQQSMQKFDRLGGLLDGINTGAFKGTTTQLKSIAKSAGVDLDGLGVRDDVAPAQAAKAIANEIALQLRNPSGGAGMPGAMSDSDREFLMQMVPGLETTPEGNKLLVDYWRRVNQRGIEVARMAREYTKKNGGKFDYGFYDELSTYSEKNPLFAKEQRQTPNNSGWSVRPRG